MRVAKFKRREQLGGGRCLPKPSPPDLAVGLDAKALAEVLQLAALHAAQRSRVEGLARRQRGSRLILFVGVLSDGGDGLSGGRRRLVFGSSSGGSGAAGAAHDRCGVRCGGCLSGQLAAERSGRGRGLLRWWRKKNQNSRAPAMSPPHSLLLALVAVVALGGAQPCVGVLYGAGDRSEGQVPSPADGATFAALAAATRPVQALPSGGGAAAAGLYHSVFIDTEGYLHSQGQNDFGELGERGLGLGDGCCGRADKQLIVQAAPLSVCTGGVLRGAGTRSATPGRDFFIASQCYLHCSTPRIRRRCTGAAVA